MSSSPKFSSGAPRSADYARRVRAQRSTPQERAAAGKAARKVLPLADHSQLNLGRRADPVDVLPTTHCNRRQESPEQKPLSIGLESLSVIPLGLGLRSEAVRIFIESVGLSARSCRD